MIYERADNQGPGILHPVCDWGLITIYLEWGTDSFITRQVNAYANGNVLRYDRSHWVDSYGMLGDREYSKTLIEGRQHVYSIEANEFSAAWTNALKSPLWEKQAKSARMEEMGTEPIWLVLRRGKQP